MKPAGAAWAHVAAEGEKRGGLLASKATESIRAPPIRNMHAQAEENFRYGPVKTLTFGCDAT
jgi:hypothetical protein